MSCRWASRSAQPPVVEDKHVGFSEAGEQTRNGALGAGERQLVEQARDATVEHSEPPPARSLSPRA